ncbi:MAG: DUF1543 domain-containing protein [Neisseria sp.]|nr:DUF1543 domain-containing protein [Neisseria sp.]
MKLFMIKLGALPKGRLIEQHDMFFGIAEKVQDLVPQFEAAWPEAADNWHIDCWREVKRVGEWQIRIVPREHARAQPQKLFFVNLGGYKRGEFEEYHHKMLLVADSSKAAVQQAKDCAFYREFDFEGAVSHIDDHHGVDIDELYNLNDVLSAQYKAQYALDISPAAGGAPEDALHIGYLSRRRFLAE